MQSVCLGYPRPYIYIARAKIVTSLQIYLSDHKSSDSQAQESEWGTLLKCISENV